MSATTPAAASLPPCSAALAVEMPLVVALLAGSGLLVTAVVIWAMLRPGSRLIEASYRGLSLRAEPSMPPLSATIEDIVADALGDPTRTCELRLPGQVHIRAEAATTAPPASRPAPRTLPPGHLPNPLPFPGPGQSATP